MSMDKEAKPKFKPYEFRIFKSFKILEFFLINNEFLAINIREKNN